MEKLDTLVLKDNVDHKRAFLVMLTPKGQTTMQQINVAQAAWINQLSDGLGARNLKQALNLLKTVREESESL